MDWSYLAKTVQVLLPGVKYTLGLFFITIVISIPFGMLLSFISNGRGPLRPIVKAYVFILRGTPLMLQLFFVYFGLPFIPVIGKYFIMDRFPAACVAFILNYAAYFCEIFRGGLLSIDRGQYEAAQVLGISRIRTTFHIVIPQMIKVVLPSVSNETITLVKDTALATAIGVIDVMHLTKSRVSATANVWPFAVAAVFYLIMTFVLTKIFSYLEKKYSF